MLMRVSQLSTKMTNVGMCLAYLYYQRYEWRNSTSNVVIHGRMFLDGKGREGLKGMQRKERKKKRKERIEEEGKKGQEKRERENRKEKWIMK